MHRGVEAACDVTFALQAVSAAVSKPGHAAHPVQALENLIFVLRGSVKEAGGEDGLMGNAETVIKASLTGAVLAGPAANERGAGYCHRGHTLVLRFPPSPLLSLQTCHPTVGSRSPPSRKEAADVNMYVSHRGPGR